MFFPPVCRGHRARAQSQNPSSSRMIAPPLALNLRSMLPRGIARQLGAHALTGAARRELPFPDREMLVHPRGFRQLTSKIVHFAHRARPRAVRTDFLTGERWFPRGLRQLTLANR